MATTFWFLMNMKQNFSQVVNLAHVDVLLQIFSVARKFRSSVLKTHLLQKIVKCQIE